MQVIKTFEGLERDAALAWLYELEHEANTKPRLCPSHWSSDTPPFMYVDPSHWPVYVRTYGDHFLGLFASRPNPGEALILVTATPVGDNALHVDVWCDDRILVGAAKLDDLLVARFGPAQTPKADDSPGCLVEIFPVRPPKGNAPGAHVQVCNEWLQEELAESRDQSPGPIVYNTWLRLYIAEHGEAPLDPRRSFCSAVQRCRTRLLRDDLLEQASEG